MMKYEIIGRPPGPDAVDAVRRDFTSLLRDLEASPATRVSVLFGFAWGNEIYEQDWLTLELTGRELRDRIDAAEASGVGRIGSDDLYITIPDVRAQRTYCHEADVHISAEDSTNAYLESQRQEWIRNGWQVDGREVPYTTAPPDGAERPQMGPEALDMADAEEVRQKRDALKRAYGLAYTRLSEILFREDPIGINFEENTDEYEPEAGTILPRLRDTRSAADVRQIVHEEFVEWFDASTAGPPERYQVVAARIWEEVIPLLRTR